MKQKSALYSRMFQSIGSMMTLSGYGVGTENPSEHFVVEALGKVYKINTVCNKFDYKACGISPVITLSDGSTKIPFPMSLKELNPNLLSGGTSYNEENIVEGGIVDTLPSFFTTINGDSVAAYYNPYCGMSEANNFVIKNKMCVNFIYDVNGAKGPNRIGKDMGVMTAFYAMEPVLAAPVISRAEASVAHVVSQSEGDISANTYCENNNARVPTLDELASVYVNLKLFNGQLSGLTWSGSRDTEDSSKAWVVDLNNGEVKKESTSASLNVRCVEKM